MKQALKDLYREVILRHNKDPYHYELPKEADLTIQAYNPVCGDKFTLYLQVKEDRISQAYFSGYGCAISKASTSVLIQRLEGLPLSEFQALFETFSRYVLPGEAGSTGDADETFSAFSGARDFPGRLPCVMLSWESLRDKLLTEAGN